MKPSWWCSFALLSVMAPLRGASGVASEGRRRSLRKYAALTTASATAVFAGFELSESLLELGHHHGVALLALSKMAQATALASNAGKEAVEETKLEGVERVMNRKVSKTGLRVLFFVALLAALFEVFEDVRPGGHHSTALIALAELRDTTEGAVKASRWGRFLGFFVHNCWAKLLLGLGALVTAGFELSREFFKCGAHHGAFILATSLVVKEGGEVLYTILQKKQGTRTPLASPKKTKEALE